MRRSMVCLLALVLCLGVIGCYSAPVKPPCGVVFSDIKAPLDPDVNKTELGAKMGSAKTISILGLVAMGDCSTKTAAETGGVETVTHTDYEYFNVLGVYQRFVVKVYGN
jgi:hypothetical protein